MGYMWACPQPSAQRFEHRRYSKVISLQRMGRMPKSAPLFVCCGLGRSQLVHFFASFIERRSSYGECISLSEIAISHPSGVNLFDAISNLFLGD